MKYGYMCTEQNPTYCECSYGWTNHLRRIIVCGEDWVGEQIARSRRNRSRILKGKTGTVKGGHACHHGPNVRRWDNNCQPEAWRTSESTQKNTVEWGLQIVGQNNSEQTPNVDVCNTETQPTLRKGRVHHIQSSGCNREIVAYTEVSNNPLCIYNRFTLKRPLITSHTPIWAPKGILF